MGMGGLSAEGGHEKLCGVMEMSYTMSVGSHTTVCICQISSNYKLKNLPYVNFTYVKRTKIYSCKKSEAFFKMFHWYF